MSERIQSVSGATTVETELNLGGLETLVNNVFQAQRRSVIVASEQWRKEVTLHMKINARWTDRTGDARGSLGVVPEYGEDEFVLVLTGGVHYMFYLEMLHAGNFSILGPTLNEMADILLDRIGAVRE